MAVIGILKAADNMHEFQKHLAGTVTHKSSKVFAGVGIFGLCTIAIAVASIFFYKQYESLLETPELLQQQQAAATIQQLGEVFILPKDEQPSIATIVDVSKVIDQPFFSQAQNGDTVFLFSQDGRVVLFRPAEKKIVNVGTLAAAQVDSATIGEEFSQELSTETASAAATQ